MNIIGLDPAPEKTAWCVYDGGEPVRWGYEDNVMLVLPRITNVVVAIEEVVSYGLGFDKHLRDTIAWAGVFAFQYGGVDAVTKNTEEILWVPRSAVKRHFGIASGTNVDSAIRKALIDEYGGRKALAGPQKCVGCKGRGKTGLGKARATCVRCNGDGKGAPAGVLHGMAGDCWQALAVAVTAAAMLRRDNKS